MLHKIYLTGQFISWGSILSNGSLLIFYLNLQAQEEAEARDLGIGLLRSPDELSEGEKGIDKVLFIEHQREMPNRYLEFFKQ